MVPAFELNPFFELTPDLVCIARKDGYFEKVNPSVLVKLEYTEEELYAREIASFIHPDDREVTAARRKELLNGRALINFQNRYVSKSGKIVWLHWTSIYYEDLEVVFAIAKDVTERKLKEQEVEEKYRQFKGLATHFKKTIEKEKKYLAVELHEELAQLASIVKMDIDWISNNTPDLSEASRQRLEHAHDVSDLLVNAIRKITYAISPNMLEDLGLHETLKWLCDEFELRHGISCQYEGNCNEEHLSQEVKLDFYRICQELLNNVTSHAEASQVYIRLEPMEEKIRLSFTDNGKGFKIDHQDRSGLTGIRERAASINGSLHIDSGPGRGTHVSITIGINRDEEIVRMN
jgi:PAS domain S-box-containing protein